ncbi:MAG: class I SAM-dependent methyltransferase [Magnetococcales bacterium]|nr:class I SAM-dependent methyltransferase [Magnetococcales bacterium]
MVHPAEFFVCIPEIKIPVVLVGMLMADQSRIVLAWVIQMIKSLYWTLSAWVLHPRRRYLAWLKWQNKYFAQLACKAMQWRGYSQHPVHPKHLFDPKTGSYVEPFLKPGIHFLDVGCGVGAVCLKACEYGAARTVGIEYNPDNIRITRESALARGVVVEVYPIDLEKTPYPFADDTFDVIHFSDVMEHLENRIACLKELKRIKKDEAPIVISVPNRDTSWKRQLRQAGIDSRDDTDHKIEYSKEQLYQEIASAGLRLESPLFPIVPSFPWHGLFALSAAVSPALYKRLQQWKYDYMKRKPEESMGWSFHVR